MLASLAIKFEPKLINFEQSINVNRSEKVLIAPPAVTRTAESSCSQPFSQYGSTAFEVCIERLLKVYNNPKLSI